MQAIILWTINYVTASSQQLATQYAHICEKEELYSEKVKYISDVSTSSMSNFISNIGVILAILSMSFQKK